MNKKIYLSLLKDKRWIKRRNEILTRDRNTCQYCGANNRYMHVHHMRYEEGKKPWEYDDDDLITLCDNCHENETNSSNSVYEDYKMLRETFKEKGLSMILLHSLLCNITDTLKRKDEGDCAMNGVAYKYIVDCVCGTQNISDIFAVKRCGFDMKFLVDNCYPDYVEDYNSI